MAWSNIHPDAPLDDDGRPVHPEQGYPICGYEKTDAKANNGRKREDLPYCLQAAGWGTDRSTGHCRKHYGGSPGAPEGWRNGNARHLLFSEAMTDDDREVFEAVVRGEDDGELMSVDDMADMLKSSIGWEFTRLQRAIDHVPDAELVERFRCPNCGNTHDGKVLDSDDKTSCGGDKRLPSGDFVPCDIPATRDAMVPQERFVTFGDKSFERKESHLANLIRTYKQVAEGTDVHVTGDHTVRGDPEQPVEVNISHVAVDLPEDETVSPDDEDEGE